MSFCDPKPPQLYEATGAGFASDTLILLSRKTCPLQADLSVLPRNWLATQSWRPCRSATNISSRTCVGDHRPVLAARPKVRPVVPKSSKGQGAPTCWCGAEID